VLHFPSVRLFDSPVVPSLDVQAGAVFSPSRTPMSTVIDELLLNLACDPPPSPTFTIKVFPC